MTAQTNIRHLFDKVGGYFVHNPLQLILWAATIALCIGLAATSTTPKIPLVIVVLNLFWVGSLFMSGLAVLTGYYGRLKVFLISMLATTWGICNYGDDLYKFVRDEPQAAGAILCTLFLIYVVHRLSFGYRTRIVHIAEASIIRPAAGMVVAKPQEEKPL